MACFVNVSMQKGQGHKDLYPSEDDDCDLADSFRSAMKISTGGPHDEPTLNLDTDSKEVEIITLPNDDRFEQKKILFAISQCVLGNSHAIKQYLDTSAEAKLFLYGRDETGNTTLILAAAEESHEMVSLLLQYGADVNAVNHDGRSALMEAALWGRIGNVRALLNFTADKFLRDRGCRCALDLAGQDRKNEKERYRRFRREAAESVPIRDRDRRHIVILLDDSTSEKRKAYTTPLSKNKQGNYYFRKSQTEMAITLCGPIQKYSVPRISKTAAVLDRGDQFARISGTSGWGANSQPRNYKMRPHWVEQVCYIASTIGHAFQSAPDPSWDQGIPGQYFASHAEKKLVAYFLDKHIFMSQDREPDQALRNSILEVEESLEEGKCSSVAWAKVCGLEERKEKLAHELFGADDRLLGDSYDEQAVARLNHDIRAIDEALSSHESDAHVATMRNREKKKRMLLKREKIHQSMMELSRNEPPISLRKAVILSSNKVCEDCDTFRKKANDYFQLNIEMNWVI